MDWVGFNEAGATMAPETARARAETAVNRDRFNEAGATMAPETVPKEIMKNLVTKASMRPGQQWPRKLGGRRGGRAVAGGFNEAGATMAPETIVRGTTKA